LEYLESNDIVIQGLYTSSYAMNDNGVTVICIGGKPSIRCQCQATWYCITFILPQDILNDQQKA